MAAPATYGVSVYNTVVYGIISSALGLAQTSKTRETGLQVAVLDERLNAWQYWAGSSAFPTGIGWGLYASLANHESPLNVNYWSYRGSSDMVKIDNGNIIRVRVGNPADGADRQIWIQTITDPTVAAQWTSWAVLYSGTHQGSVTIENDGAGSYNVYHAKNGVLYKNNSSIWNPATDGYTNYKVIAFFPVENSIGAGWAFCIAPDAADGKRKCEFFWTVNAGAGVFKYDPYNYCFVRPGISSYYDGTKVHRIQTGSFQTNPREGDFGVSVVHATHDLTANLFDSLSFPQTLKGIGGGAGKNYLGGHRIVKLSDGFYYMFMFEVHENMANEGMTNLGYGFPVWMRSKDLIHWSDPVVGPAITDAWGGRRLVESGGYLYFSTTEFVYRRPVGTVTYDVSNYVPEVQFDLPRDNQPGSGTATVANPGAINDALKTLSDREITIKPGLRVADGTYEYSSFSRWFIRDCANVVDGAINRLTLRFGDIWDRLDFDMRDVTNFLGQVIWDDWSSGQRNKLFNYYFGGNTVPPETTTGYLTGTGIVLFTGWKGHNPDISAHFSSTAGNPRIVARYLDTKNYIYLEKVGTTLYLRTRRNNVVNTMDSWAVPADTSPTLRLRLRFNHYSVWHNGVQLTAAAENTSFISDDPAWITKQGYAGFSSSSGSYRITNFHLEDYEQPITTETMVRYALAMGDFHDVVVSGATSRTFGLTWGPQTDLVTPAAALLAALQVDKLQLIWKNGVIQVGKFDDQSPVRTIQDEIYESDQIDNTKRRINMAVIDGNDKNWLEVDTADANTRGRMVNAYFDLPELLDLSSIQTRAREEIKQGSKGASPGGKTQLLFDVARMDGVVWIDNQGRSKVVRVEGFSVDINQSTTPHQRQTWDLGEYSLGSADSLMDPNQVIPQ